MSEQAEKFLAQWKIEHIRRVARSDREDEAGRLAIAVSRRCSESGDQQPGFGSCCWGEFDRQYASSVGRRRVPADVPRPDGWPRGRLSFFDRFKPACRNGISLSL